MVFDDRTYALSHIPIKAPVEDGDGGPIGWKVYEVPASVGLDRPETVDYEDFFVIGEASVKWESGRILPERKKLFHYRVGNIEFYKESLP